METYLAALDQGTTTSRAILFNSRGEIVAKAQYPFRQIFPQPGWVEHDPMEIWASERRALAEITSHIDPRQVAAAIQAEVERLRREGIPEDLYQAALRKSYGREVMSYNDIDSVANGMIDAHFNGFSIFDVTNRYKAITKEKIEARLQQVMNPQYSALSVVKAED